MKTFRDLEHEDKTYSLGTQARMDFKNGYGVSVTTGPTAYCDEGEYELAVFKGGDLCYDTPITDDVIGWLTPRQITVIMKKVQTLPKES